jgi:hypothetical protein
LFRHGAFVKRAVLANRIPRDERRRLAPTFKGALLSLKLAVQNESIDPATSTRRFTLAVADAGQIRLRSRIVKDGRTKLVHADAAAIAELKAIRATPAPWRRLPPPFTKPINPTTES